MMVEPTNQNRSLAAVATMGIVFGDLGTSPLYIMPTILVLSLLFWTLLITISVKYCLFVMRADNDGEGGILALCRSSA